MSDRITILKRIEDLSKSPQFNAYSKVVIHIDDETDYVVGNDLGRTFEITNPFGTIAMARQILAKLNGFQYQPYKATGAILDPAAEIGDAIAVKDLYGGLYTRERTFGRLMKANIAAPHDEEINHEYKFETPQERKVKRQFEDVRATLSVQARSIDAKVSKEGFDDNKTFAWSLTEEGFFIHNGEITPKIIEDKSALFTFTKSGLAIKGYITATEGKIGGFNLNKDGELYYGMTSLSDTTHNGVFISKNGIALGKGAFKVTSSGVITAKNIELSGTLTIAGKSITAANLELGARQSANNYSNWNGTTNTVNSNGANWTSGYRWTNNASDEKVGVSLIKATRMICTRFSLGDYDVGTAELTYKDGNGNSRTATFLIAQ